MDLIVAIDIIDGQLVRLSQGAYETREAYGSIPVEVAKGWRGGAHSPAPRGPRRGERGSGEEPQGVGGHREADDPHRWEAGSAQCRPGLGLQRGAAMANLGSVAVKAPDLVFTWLGSTQPTA